MRREQIGLTHLPGGDLRFNRGELLLGDVKRGLRLFLSQFLRQQIAEPLYNV